jgi:hypothetical protein
MELIYEHPRTLLNITGNNDLEIFEKECNKYRDHELINEYLLSCLRIACNNNNLVIMNCIYEKIFNAPYIEKYIMNCFVIACKNNNYEMIKWCYNKTKYINYDTIIKCINIIRSNDNLDIMLWLLSRKELCENNTIYNINYDGNSAIMKYLLSKNYYLFLKNKRNHDIDVSYLNMDIPSDLTDSVIKKIMYNLDNYELFNIIFKDIYENYDIRRITKIIDDKIAKKISNINKNNVGNLCYNLHNIIILYRKFMRSVR